MQEYKNNQDDIADTWHCDVLVVGSGAGGLSAAIAAAHQGLHVVVAERAAKCGGATARSGGWAWLPANHLAKADGVNEERAMFRQYLRAVIGDADYQSERVEAFLENAPKMAAFLQENGVKWAAGSKICDIYGNLAGAGTGHRSLAAAPFYASELPSAVLNVLPDQFRMTSFWGMGIMAGADLGHFLQAMKKPSSLAYVSKRFAIHLWDKLVHGRNMQLVNGLALIGRLLQAAQAKGVQIHTETRVESLLQDECGKVCGAYLQTATGRVKVLARRGVVLATGGYPASIELRRNFPRNPDGTQHWTLAPDEADGSGLRLAQSVGGVLDEQGRSPAAWCPISLVHFRDGTTGVFPHIADRAKPHTLAVLANGKRFVNEANGYFDFVQGMLENVPVGEPVEAWLIGDKRAVRDYMFGFSKPRPIPRFVYTHYLKYLHKADTLAELAAKCGIDGTQLQQTVNRFNQHARQGHDPDFERGSTPFNRYGGDASTSFPNPSLAPLEQAPFYAVKIQVGSFGTFAGIAVDEKARVLSADGTAIAGLYAVGNDQKSVFSGNYPSGGINIGPALTFGYIAGCDLANQ